MQTSFRIWIAASLALIGALSVYVGAMANAAALGGTLGYVLIFPGIAFIATAPLPVRKLPVQKWRSILLGALRYLSMPVFLLGAFMLAPELGKLFGANAQQVQGVYLAVFLTAAGLLAITWPELHSLIQWFRRGRQIDV